ncbi:MAG: DUF2189 domain-containing protein [Paracoccus sp. (in: a-proteobacteria)]|nr:DUF2189 domain-containing protein [Paracoccus sp. (in: a-proteobacteria)]
MARHNTTNGPRAEPDVLPEPVRIGLADLRSALASGWRDFRRAPAFGLLFSAFYVLGGLVLAAVALAIGQDWWLIPFILGFPLIAPFAAVGLYEVSRRIELAEPLDWSQVIRVVIAQKDRQIPSMAMVILLMFMFWVFVAHTVFAVFFGTVSLTHVTSSIALLTEPRGLVMLLVGTVIGAGFAFALFSFTVVGLPLLLDVETDFISAIITSIEAVRLNFSVLMTWAALIAAMLFVAMLPVFLGLFVVMPVLGHASWHLYRRLMPDGVSADG